MGNCKSFDKSIVEKNKYDFNGYSGNFYVIDVYDGDTITILMPIETHIYEMKNKNEILIYSDSNPKNDINKYKIKIRLYGIDTNELKPLKTIENREEYIKKANEAKEYLKNKICNKIVRVEFKELDKYGRNLANIYLNDVNINKLMILKGYANEYFGGSK